jgi:ABC-type polar amino acid transport system ATPase subunit
MKPTIIEVAGLKKSFDGKPVLKGVDFSVQAKQLTVLMGPSGCGKSTLLRCLNGLETFDEGRISIDGFTVETNSARAASEQANGRALRQLRRRMGIVFQAFNLFPHMTALENVERPPMIVQGLAKGSARELALQLLAKVGLQDQTNLYPAQLSGGQQQRAAIARALAMKPQVLLYDEPTSALDPGLVGEVLQVMKQLDNEGITQVVVTHEMQFARRAAEKILFMADGVVVEQGEARQIFSAPADVRTREFLQHFL